MTIILYGVCLLLPNELFKFNIILNNVMLKNIIYRKTLGHIIPNMIIGSIIFKMTSNKSKYKYIVTSICLSILFEMLQLLSSNRVFSLIDILINFMGYILTFIIYLISKSYILSRNDCMKNINKYKNKNMSKIPELKDNAYRYIESKIIDFNQNNNLKDVLSEFFQIDKVISVIKLNEGYINDTYKVVLPECEYILQRINNNVFKSPFGLMHNISEVTKYIRKKLIYEGKNPQRGVLNIVNNKYDQKVLIVNNQYWRVMEYISNSKAYDIVENIDTFSEMGKVIGRFQKMLDGFPQNILDDTIQHFHDTYYRYKEFKKVIKLDEYNLINNCLPEIEYINNHKKIYREITDKLNDGTIPYRVTHNDTKPSNVLFDQEDNKALCLIDLDTVMRGSLVYDYGDALRIGATGSKEDERDLEKVKIRLDYIEAFTYAFLKEVKGLITKSEVENLYNGYFIMTIEVAMRFLTDYLAGNKYFKVNYDDHNLIRSKNQIKLCIDIEKNKENIIKIINSSLKKLYYPKDYIL